MWYFIVFLLTGPVQFGPFPHQSKCEDVFEAVLTYPHRTANGWTAVGCWVVDP